MQIAKTLLIKFIKKRNKLTRQFSKLARIEIISRKHSSKAIFTIAKLILAKYIIYFIKSNKLDKFKKIRKIKKTNKQKARLL